MTQSPVRVVERGGWRENQQLQIEQRHTATNCSGRFSLACAPRTNAHAPYRPGRCGPHLIALTPLLRDVRGRLPLLTTFNSIKLHVIAAVDIVYTDTEIYAH